MESQGTQGNGLDPCGFGTNRKRRFHEMEADINQDTEGFSEEPTQQDMRNPFVQYSHEYSARRKNNNCDEQSKSEVMFCAC
ncbi:unnamed protein product [Moneuplotes crassus]|uniref:Uncharacterized protein n=1 Tax=Euplotes crassus TaxID=5936 RepID=A0AAD1XXW4_EUPCR|nr:unnamed protein product [Moneuplotes crassus]